MVTMISAMARDRVIGAGGGGIPWHLPRDSARFRAYTQHKHMLLGRRTFEEMTGWFTTQTPLVLTSRDHLSSSVGTIVRSVPDAIAIAMAMAMAAPDGCNELVVSGGAQVYASALPRADRLVLTLIDATIAGTALFPDYRAHCDWLTVSEEHFAADHENAHPMTFLTLDRARGA